MDHAYIVIGLYWLYSAVIGGMPEPQTCSGLAYRWAYASLHILAGNVSLAMQQRFKVPVEVPPGSAIEHREQTVVMTPPSEG